MTTPTDKSEELENIKTGLERVQLTLNNLRTAHAQMPQERMTKVELMKVAVVIGLAAALSALAAVLVLNKPPDENGLRDLIVFLTHFDEIMAVKDENEVRNSGS